jgi:hypothetical protein
MYRSARKQYADETRDIACGLFLAYRAAMGDEESYKRITEEIDRNKK